jgi:hypothetical protein
MYTKGPYIFDEEDRTLLLRGCNFGGSSKLPASPPDARGQGPLSLKNPGEVSFVGRPFPLEEAEKNFRDLRRWGFTFLRFIITWEAIEHAGPGIYDEDYLAYLRELLLIAEKEGVSVFMDPHQDAWSRWTGGDGAPFWILEKLGMNMDTMDATGAAVTMQHYRELQECKAYRGKGGMAKLFWPINYSRYATATLFTLFFAGNTYAPDLTVEGMKIQDWLQDRYIACFKHCFERLRDCKALAGWDVMNEPNPGFIGCRDIQKLENYTLSLGPMPTPWEAMQAASGRAVKCAAYIPWLNGPLKTGSVTLNPGRARLFMEGFSCPWKQAGVWTQEGGEFRLLKKDHFALYEGRPARFVEDFLKPFTRKFISGMRLSIQGSGRPALFFIEGVAQGEDPAWQASDGGDVVNAFHRYDGFTLFSKTFRPWLGADEVSGKIMLGRKKAASVFADKLAQARAWTREQMGDIPCLLGEFGLPYDLNKKRAYNTGDYSLHEEALSRYYNAIDQHLLHSTIWVYTSDNTHDEGDRWNGEDLSIVYNGEGRAVKGWFRPYPMATAGRPIRFSWDRKKSIFRYLFKADVSIKAPTVICAPAMYFGENPVITIRPALGDSKPPAGNSEPLSNKAESRQPSSGVYLQSPDAAGFTTQYKPQENLLLIYNTGFTGTAELCVRPV